MNLSYLITVHCILCFCNDYEIFQC